MPFDFITALPIIAIIVMLAFHAGRASKQYPSEEVMFLRLVELRRNRKVKAYIEAKLDDEIETAAERAANRSQQVP